MPEYWIDRIIGWCPVLRDCIIELPMKNDKMVVGKWWTVIGEKVFGRQSSVYLGINADPHTGEARNTDFADLCRYELNLSS
jgi:hypothetical protein